MSWINPVDWASAQPCTLAGHDDCHYWGLTLGQCMKYHGRLSAYYRQRAQALRVKAEKVRVSSEKWLLFAFGLAVGNCLLQLALAVAK
ncbi:hypothetical protein [Micromonospora sp. GCM10011541]|uniref:hypothetical protein n=1 Tax=Micromonospora sp. GCM10011541 TaxID=3317336 RepID=UPI0036124158